MRISHIPVWRKVNASPVLDLRIQQVTSLYLPVGRKQVNKLQIIFRHVVNIRQDANIDDEGRVTLDGVGGDISQEETYLRYGFSEVTIS